MADTTLHFQVHKVWYSICMKPATCWFSQSKVELSSTMPVNKSKQKQTKWRIRVIPCQNNQNPEIWYRSPFRFCWNPYTLPPRSDGAHHRENLFYKQSCKCTHIKVKSYLYRCLDILSFINLSFLDLVAYTFVKINIFLRSLFSLWWNPMQFSPH